MNPEYFKNLPDIERKELLEANAVSIEDTKYTRPLAPEEIAAFKDQLSENSILQATILDEKKEVIAGFKARLEPVSRKISEALSAVKFKAIDCEGRVYKMADYEEQMIHMIDSEGILLNSRRMQPHERQLRIDPPTKQKFA